MDAQLKAKWVEALRSGKYQQTAGVLHRPKKGYCCLGVLCEAAGAQFVEDANGSEYWPILDGRRLDRKNQDEYLSASFLEQAGFRSPVQDTLAAMNDAGKSFAEIADYIEANL